MTERLPCFDLQRFCILYYQGFGWLQNYSLARQKKSNFRYDGFPGLFKAYWSEFLAQVSTDSIIFLP